MDNNIFIIDEPHIGVRIDSFLSKKLPEYSRSFIQKAIEDGQVLINDKAVSKNYKLRISDSVFLDIAKPTPIDAVPCEMDIDIIYEDEYIAVINKEKGIVVHPAPGNYENTLVNGLLYRLSDSLSGIGGKLRPGIVHRIDKDTSGLLVIAKNDMAHISLSAQLKEHTASRIYDAVVLGRVKEDSGTIDKPLGRDKKNRVKIAVSADGKRAVTHYEIVKRYQRYTHIRCSLETGRTHQIRVHLASLGHPLAGDALYGAPQIKRLAGQCLHASKLVLTHPKTGEVVQFETQLPAYFADFLKTLKEE